MVCAAAAQVKTKHPLPLKVAGLVAKAVLKNLKIEQEEEVTTAEAVPTPVNATATTTVVVPTPVPTFPATNGTSFNSSVIVSP
jgi:hypothetical protein